MTAHISVLLEHKKKNLVLYNHEKDCVKDKIINSTNNNKKKQQNDANGYVCNIH